MVNLLWKENKLLFSNNGNSVTEGAMPFPNQMTGQMVNPAYSQQIVFVKKKKVWQEDFFLVLGLLLFLVVATSLGLFLFSSKEQTWVACG